MMSWDPQLGSLAVATPLGRVALGVRVALEGPEGGMRGRACCPGRGLDVCVRLLIPLAVDKPALHLSCDSVGWKAIRVSAHACHLRQTCGTPVLMTG
jgi:hypothetical protein